MTPMHRGDRIWRLGKTFPLRCVFVRTLPGTASEVRTSLFAKQSLIVPNTDIFADKDACWAELRRRANQPGGEPYAE